MDTIGALVTLTNTDVLGLQNAGKKTLVEIRFLLESMGLKLSDDRLPPSVVEERALPIVAESTILEEALYHLVRAVSTERNAQILVRLWGWNGEAPRTLDSVGKEFTLTRERIRQIEKRALQRLRKRRLDAPLSCLPSAT